VLGEPGEPERSAEASAEAAAAESERYLRLAAEFDNYKKRTVREFEDILKRANARLLRDLIAIVDNFERALTVDPDQNDNAAYRKGVDLIYNQLLDLLKKESVTALETVGKPFDPNLHEALMQMESDEHDDGIICREILKGYSIDGKVLRHARVAVSRGRQVSDEKTNNNT
jgi:molecular chaperone GrpE